MLRASTNVSYNPAAVAITGGTITGAAVASSTVTGTTTNNNAATGIVGEFVTATVASGSPVPLSNGTSANVTSISLTAGDWDISAVVNFGLTGATGTLFVAGISLTSATLPIQAGGSGLGTDALATLPLITTVLTAVPTLPIPPVRLSITSTTTVYLVANQTFTVGASGAYGTLRARRCR